MYLINAISDSKFSDISTMDDWYKIQQLFHDFSFQQILVISSWRWVSMTLT